MTFEKRDYIYLSIGIALMLLWNHADYLYQASLWKWWTWLPLDRTAAKWGIFDFIPHDSWHVVQSVRNHAGLVAAWALFDVGRIMPYVMRFRRPAHWAMAFSLAVILIAYALTRAVAFTLPLELMN